MTTELALRLPLSGVQLIEASAGTGKTHTLTLLHLRLVIEAGCEVREILVVTYTRAATAELRERLRLRLRRALQLAESEVAAREEDAALVALIAAASAREGPQALRARLRRAVAEMDLAPVHTIHGFCQRALEQHALEAGRGLSPRELLSDARPLLEEVATAFWRRTARDPAGARALEAFRSPAQLARRLQELVGADRLEPSRTPVQGDRVDAELQRARAGLHAAIGEHAAQAREALRLAAASGAIVRTYSKDAAVDPVFASLQRWHESDADAALHEHSARYTTESLRAKAKPDKGALPESPLFDALQRWFEAQAAAEAHARDERLELLHRLRAEGAAAHARLKRERGLADFDDLVRDLAAALQGGAGDALAARLQAQYRVALVDEFQDTDPRQAALFFRLFARAAPADDGARAARLLVLIGDPKQAIYRFRGGDVEAYLSAAARADARHVLQRNFRSRPAVLRANEMLYTRAGIDAFAHPGIGFQPVQPGGQRSDDALLCDGAPMPGLTLLALESIDAYTALEQARAAAAAACAAAVLDLLHDGAAGRVLRRGPDGQQRALAAGDVAILVETHDDTRLMRDALAACGIPSAARLRESVLQSDEAEDLRRVLLALRAPGDESRLRAALATALIGFDAVALAALEKDDAPLRTWQLRLQEERIRLPRTGPLALVTRLTAARAQALLAWPRGEQRLANYLQLGEMLQDLAREAAGVDALLDAWERRIEAADADAEEEQPRRDSDAERVAILTLHRSKGLEFDCVFLPLIATHGGGRPRRGLEPATLHDAGERVLVLADGDEALARRVAARETVETRQERLRLLYVALTRARLATWICWGAAKSMQHTALAWLLHRAPGEDAVAVPGPERVRADLAALAASAPEAIAVRTACAASPRPRWVARRDAVAPAARHAQRVPGREWWVYSYSMLAREAANLPEQAAAERGAEDEAARADTPDPQDARFAGARFGNALHQALEGADFGAWRDWRGELPPPQAAASIDAALRAEGYGDAEDLVAGRRLLTRLIAATLNAPLPEGVRLCDLAPAARRDEMEFHLALAPTRIADLLACLHAHGVAVTRQGFGTRRAIEGLLTGRIDLVYLHQGRWYVLDYKSNRLSDYSPEALQRAVQESEYDLQYVLYTLALHRWLRFRLGPRYDYTRDFGGVRYLFCRGLDPVSGPMQGVHLALPSAALIHALDALFAARETPA